MLWSSSPQYNDDREELNDPCSDKAIITFFKDSRPEQLHPSNYNFVDDENWAVGTFLFTSSPYDLTPYSYLCIVPIFALYTIQAHNTY